MWREKVRILHSTRKIPEGRSSEHHLFSVFGLHAQSGVILFAGTNIFFLAERLEDPKPCKLLIIYARKIVVPRTNQTKLKGWIVIQWVITVIKADNFFLPAT